MVREKLKMDPILTAQEQATEVAVAALKIKTVEMIPRNEEMTWLVLSDHFDLEIRGPGC